MGVQQEQERVVPDGLARRVYLLDRVAGEPEAQAAREAVRPLVGGHLLPVGPKPGKILDLRALDAPTLKEPPPVEDRVREAQAYEAPRELELLLGGARERPVDPGQLAVLAVGVVVALLGSRALVAREQHGHALGEEEGDEEVAEHPLPERDRGGSVGRTLD